MGVLFAIFILDPSATSGSTMTLPLSISVTSTTTNLSPTCMCISYQIMCTNVSIHTANSIGVIIGVVGVVTVIFTLIIIMSVLCFFKANRHKTAILGDVLLFCVV